MGTALIAYASTHGHTASVAERVRDVLARNGTVATLAEVGEESDPDPSGFDAAVLAGSVHAGEHQASLRTWARHHAESLNGMPTIFLSVSLTAAEDVEDEEARRTVQAHIDDFLEETGWRATDTLAVAGALQFSRYNFFTRTLMRLILRRGGHAEEAGTDHVYTDWEALEAFATEFAERAGLGG
jgi:menaquinone-dependent protoporphyrinogen oxidase